MTKTWGILNMRRTFSSSKCFVVILNRTARETELITRVTNNNAPNKPWRVMIRLNPRTLKPAIESPGVKMLNNAGIAMKIEKSGINTHVLFKKNPKLIFEKNVSAKHKT